MAVTARSRLDVIVPHFSAVEHCTLQECATGNCEKQASTFKRMQAQWRPVGYSQCTRCIHGCVQTVELKEARNALALSQFESPKPPKLRTN